MVFLRVSSTGGSTYNTIGWHRGIHRAMTWGTNVPKKKDEPKEEVEDEQEEEEEEQVVEKQEKVIYDIPVKEFAPPNCNGNVEAGRPVIGTGDGNWDPNDEKYKSCCCHVKTFTYVWGIIEAMFVAIILVCVITALARACRNQVHYHYHYDNAGIMVPVENEVDGHESDVNSTSAIDNHPSKNEDEEANATKWSTTASSQETRRDKRSHKSGDKRNNHNRNEKHGKKKESHHRKKWYRYQTYVYHQRHAYFMGRPVDREMLVAALVWMSIIAVCVGMLLHGLKHGKWGYLVPHLTLHAFAIIWNVIAIIIAVLLSLAFAVRGGRFMCTFFWGSILTTFNIYLFKTILRCCQFIKDQQTACGGAVSSSSVVPVYLVPGPGQNIAPGSTIRMGALPGWTTVAPGQMPIMPPGYQMPVAFPGQVPNEQMYEPNQMPEAPPLYPKVNEENKY